MEGIRNKIGTPVEEIHTPAFLLDKSKAKKNCDRMLKTCQDLGLKLRAQTKTHKTM